MTSATLSPTIFTLSSTLVTLSSTQATLLSTPTTRPSMPATISPTLATRSSTPTTLLSTATTVFATPLTLSSTLCVAFKFCATAIRASSCVNLSRFFSASSISVLPISLFIYFSGLHSVNCHKLVYKLHTRSALLDLLCRNSEDREDFDCYQNHHIHHFRGRIHFGVHLESSEEHF